VRSATSTRFWNGDTAGGRCCPNTGSTRKTRSAGASTRPANTVQNMTRLRATRLRHTRTSDVRGVRAVFSGLFALCAAIVVSPRIGLGIDCYLSFIAFQTRSMVSEVFSPARAAPLSRTRST